MRQSSKPLTFTEWWVGASFDTLDPRTVAERAWNAAMAQRSETGEHICQKCGLRVEPHRCGGKDAAF